MLLFIDLKNSFVDLNIYQKSIHDDVYTSILNLKEEKSSYFR